ncbi:MAG: hypothetical protein PHG66_00905 [Candidatus Colwellbacteria bacterium]|nr:hypothetical protein [Candidatus Colwellbacteria bacterium]
MESYYKFTYGNEISIYFKEELEEIETYLNRTILEEMTSYHCDGCNYCCYGTYVSKYWCEKKFKGEEDFSEYYEMCRQKGFTLKAHIEKISFEKGIVGYFDGVEFLWELDSDYKFKLVL